MRLFSGFAACCLVFAAPTAALSQAAPTSLPMDDIVAAVRSELPRDFGQGLRLVAADRDGDLLVFLLEVPARFYDEVTPQAAAEFFAGGYCRAAHAHRMFEAGLRLRIDTRAPGDERRTGLVIERCPGS